MRDRSALRLDVCRLCALLLYGLCVSGAVQHDGGWRHQRDRPRRFYNAGRREDSDRDIHPQLHQHRHEGQRLFGSSSSSASSASSSVTDRYSGGQSQQRKCKWGVVWLGWLCALLAAAWIRTAVGEDR
uniref:Secreted protein n=1 Tax=Plectus sambesii TaxID=2011161 RepID=A0A914VZM5_9BILA